MPPFPKPRFPFEYAVSDEVGALRRHKKVRAIPSKAAGRLLLATWNIANFGAHERRTDDHRLLAEILGWFDIVAIQEARDNFAGLEDVRRLLGPTYKLLLSDIAGNNERMAFLFNARTVTLLEKVGEVSIPPSQLQHVKLPGVTQRFAGFDRNPYLAAFQVGNQNSVLLTDVQSRGKKDYDAYVRYYISDHRPLWMELAV